MGDMKEKIIEILMTELRSIYCDDCRFSKLSEEEAEELYGYYGCDDCCRKCMGWEISEEKASEIADKIWDN